MQSQNDGSAGIAGAVLALIAVLGLMLFLAAAFVAFCMTALAIAAWNKPLRIGKMTIEPEHARSFVRRGIVGAFLVPGFALFVQITSEVFINWDYLSYFLLGGYVAGSLGLEMLMANQQATAIHTPPTPARPEPVSQPQSREQAPFHYASWDDEEARR